MPWGERALAAHTVEESEAGHRLDVVVARLLGEARSRVQARIEAGEVTVDGVAVGKSHRVAAGDHLVVQRAQRPLAPEPPPPVPVRFEDDHLLVVAKPAGMVTHAAGGRRRHPVLVAALQAMGVTLADTGDVDRPGIVHRLDKGTSGLLVVAKTEQARAGLVSLLRRHEVQRRYWALVEGVPDMPRATIDAPILRSPANRTRFAVGAGGRRAVTHFDVREPLADVSVLTVALETGRTHQVRVHLSSIGYPVAGDLTYGASGALAQRLGLERPALHAQRLAFRHPVTGVAVAVEEALPADLVQARNRAREGG